jgi:nitroimidazol reductase NimA-like FMN-containing flavoprotein (pyridoxamine 5'-phosphate oxidase superfamily)
MDEAIRRKIHALLDRHRIMTVATLRPDGWPQATTVGYVNEGTTIYFLCGLNSQKSANIARDDRVSVTIDEDADEMTEIAGLSMAAHARPVTDRAEGQRVIDRLPGKYPTQKKELPFAMPGPDDVRIYRLDPVVISVLDYTKGFGHTDLVTAGSSGAGRKQAACTKALHPQAPGAAGPRRMHNADAAKS